MATNVRIPTTGNAGEDAVLVEWNVGVGSTVAQGAVLAVLETAKAAMEVEAPVGGQVLQLLYAAGDEVPEHAVLAVIGEPGESNGDGEPQRDAASATAAASDDALAQLAAQSQEPSSTTPPVQPARSGRISISPRARAMARDRSIDTSAVTGSGPLGRIVIRDISDIIAAQLSDAPVAEPVNSAQLPDPAPCLAAVAAAQDAAQSGVGARNGALAPAAVIPVRGARKATAQRMHASLTQTAQLTLTRYADATALLTYAARLRTHCEVNALPKIGLNDLLMYAAARTMTRHPDANSWFDWDGIRQFEQVNLGFAVDTERALLVPVIRDAGSLTLSDLAAAAKNLIARARSGSLTVEDMDQGTFTVSNLGGLGVHWFTPVLNPPQSCILGIGATHRTHSDAPAWIPLSLTFDHRALDGAAAAATLADLAATIESIDLLSAF